MTFVTLWTTGRPTGVGQAGSPNGEPNGGLAPLLARLLRVAPHALAAPAKGGTYVWVDARGLPTRRVAREVLGHARACGRAWRAWRAWR